MLDTYLSLGLTTNEAKIYDLLSRYENLDAATIVQELKQHKKVIYDNLHRLEGKGLISGVRREGKTYYHLNDPDLLHTLLEAEEERLKQAREETDELIEKLRRRAPKEMHKQHVQLVTGVRGIKKVLLDGLESENYVAFGGSVESEDQLGATWWKNFHSKAQARGLRPRLIFNKSIEHWQKIIPYAEVRLFANIEPLTETIISGDTVSIIVWSETPIATVIENPDVAASYREFFELLWAQSSV